MSTAIGGFENAARSCAGVIDVRIARYARGRDHAIADGTDVAVPELVQKLGAYLGRLGQCQVDGRNKESAANSLEHSKPPHDGLRVTIPWFGVNYKAYRRRISATRRPLFLFLASNEPDNVSGLSLIPIGGVLVEQNPQPVEGARTREYGVPAFLLMLDCRRLSPQAK